jgi:hypothetical protein
VHLSESSDEIKERVVFVQEEKSDNEKTKLYLGVKDVYIDVSDQYNK